MAQSRQRPLSIHGFTLVELMVTVAIIGIVAAIAIPQYQRMVARARQTEAKVGLAALYVAETAFFGANSTYSAFLSCVGFSLNAGGNVRFYGLGFFPNSDSVCGPTGADHCGYCQWTPDGTPTGIRGNQNDGFYPATGKLSESAVIADETWLNGSSIVKKSEFQAETIGNIRPSTIIHDHWTINDKKVLRNSAPAF